MWQEDLHFVEISWTAAEVLRGPEVPGVEGLFSQEIQDVSFLCPPKMTGLSTAMDFFNGQNEVSKTCDKLKHELRNAYVMIYVKTRKEIVDFGLFFFCSVLKWAIQFLLSYSL